MFKFIDNLLNPRNCCMSADPTTITLQSAAVLYTALETAMLVAESATKLKANAGARSAFAIQIASYKAEMTRLEAAFPVLKPAA